jgi:hypothetical protein
MFGCQPRSQAHPSCLPVNLVPRLFPYVCLYAFINNHVSTQSCRAVYLKSFKRRTLFTFLVFRMQRLFKGGAYSKAVFLIKHCICKRWQEMLQNKTQKYRKKFQDLLSRKFVAKQCRCRTRRTTFWNASCNKTVARLDDCRGYLRAFKQNCDRSCIV